MRRIWFLLVASCSVSACIDGSGSPASVVPIGGEADDNYYSETAREYIVRGTSSVTVESGVIGAAAEARARELIGLKTVVIAYYLNDFLITKEDEESHQTFGFGAMVKYGDSRDVAIERSGERTWRFEFSQLIAGRRDLRRRLDLDGQGRFEVIIGNPSNEEMSNLETFDEWFTKTPWVPWDPEAMPASQKESLALTIENEVETPDAYFDYDALFDDGKLTIDIHAGFDEDDTQHAQMRNIFSELKDGGFQLPAGVTTWDDYHRSGPLVTTIDANDRDIRVEVRLFVGKPGESTDPNTESGAGRLKKDLEESLRIKDVVIFQGHSGAFYGFPMANWKTTISGELDDDEMREMNLREKYQIVFAEGCDTLMIGPALLSNPNKEGSNMDVITTTTFSELSLNPAVDFLRHLLKSDSRGRHRPMSIRDLLLDLDSTAMYGVHGAEDNPRLHPYADTRTTCDSCSTRSDCGSVGSACVMFDNAELSTHCAPACTSDDACGEGYRCRDIVYEEPTTVFERACVPLGLDCGP